MTGECSCGTERTYQAIKDKEYDIIVNVQGDEPSIHPEEIEMLLYPFENPDTNMVTLKRLIEDQDKARDAIKHILPQLKIQPVIISGRKSIIVENRCRELGITLLFQDIIDKEDCLKKLQKELNVQPDETAGIGDDINDIPMLKMCGINACPADALIADKVTIVCKKAGGKGAVREFIDYLVNLSN